ncbi:hypothetical protein ACA910_001071 [Epithemia clementina (nom. ined.)]
MTSLVCSALTAMIVVTTSSCHGIFGGGILMFAMAVDRSKFRTCQQTAFCRRHRNGQSARLFDYQLDADSIKLHSPPASDGATPSTDTQRKNTVWSSLSNILGKNKNEGGDEGAADATTNPADIHVRGTAPTLTGTIVNKAEETSTGSKDEQLQWTVYAMQDGILRMRMIEPYGKVPGSAYETPRITYDELILHEPKRWREAAFARLISHSTVKPKEAKAISSEKTDFLLERLISSIGSEGDAPVKNYMALEFGDSALFEEGASTIMLFRLDSFAVWLFRGEDLNAGPVVALNEESLMTFEIRRFKESDGEDEPQDKKVEEEKKHDKEIVGYWEDGLAIYADGTREEKKDVVTHHNIGKNDMEGAWEEKWMSHTDSKPYGPTSVGMDIKFPKSHHLFGLPEHASSSVLQDTTTYYKDPYRLYNLDVFEHEIDEPMSLYGAVPLIVSQSAVTGTSGVFWLNPSETFVDIRRPADGEKEESVATTSHWMSESGILDIFLLSGGSDPAKLYRQYTMLTGTPPTPPIFSLGYHQCRWNYKDEKDVYMVHNKFEELDYPYDVLWLDIEHTDGKRYFTWDEKLFPHPVEMQETLWATGRRMVTIVDPHIKRDDGYYIHKEATSKGLYVKDKNGDKDFDGWCWPGSSSYLDFTQARVREWWAEQFSFSKYKSSTPSLFTWNDMNEPSVFNGPEVTMPKDLRNLQGHEHREWHNLYGMLFHRATSEGLTARSPQGQSRPFVLTRAFFAGTQKYGAIWTGDNTADWSYLKISSPMLLSLNVAALSFVGADVGGFFGNPDAELYTRWMQTGAYQPFFRGHAHHDSKRREPWMFDEDTLVRVRRSALARYALLPMWYTLFHQAETTGMPVMRFMWMQYPKLASLYAVDYQYLVGSDLLVHPVTEPGATQVTLLLPTEDIWYHADTMELIKAEGEEKDGVVHVPWEVDMESIPVLQRGGSILSRKLWLRRSSQLMKSDPYTLFVALDRSLQAQGKLYMDDEETFKYATHDEYAFASFYMDLSGSSSMSNKVTVGQGWDHKAGTRMIERIVVAGVPTKPKGAIIGNSTATPQELELDYDDATQTMVVRKPMLSAAQDWTIQFSM